MVAGWRTAWYSCGHQLRRRLLMLLLRGCDHDRVAAGAHHHVATAACKNKNGLCSKNCGVDKMMTKMAVKNIRKTWGNSRIYNIFCLHWIHLNENSGFAAGKNGDFFKKKSTFLCEINVFKGNLFTWPDEHDWRPRAVLHHGGGEGDHLKMAGGNYMFSINVLNLVFFSKKSS